jgi:hypothetical protein
MFKKYKTFKILKISQISTSTWMSIGVILQQTKLNPLREHCLNPLMDVQCTEATT